MRKLLLLAFLAGLFQAHGALAAYSVTNTIDEFGTTASSAFTSASAYTFASGDRVEIAIVWYGDATNQPITVTDTNSNTWAQVSGSQVINFNGDGISYAWYECKNVTSAGSTHIKATFTSDPGHAGMAGLGVTGLSNSASAQSNQQGQIAPGTGTGAVTSGNITPASQPAILIGFSQNIGGNYSTGLTVTAGFTNHALSHITGVNGNGAAALGDERLTSTSAIAATFTANASVGAQDVVSFGVVIPESGGGASCTHNGYTSAGALAVPTASSTVVWRKDGSFGTTPCDGTGTQWWQPGSGSFGTQ